MTLKSSAFYHACRIVWQQMKAVIIALAVTFALSIWFWFGFDAIYFVGVLHGIVVLMIGLIIRIVWNEWKDVIHTRTTMYKSHREYRKGL